MEASHMDHFNMDLINGIWAILFVAVTFDLLVQRRRMKEMKAVIEKCARTMAEVVMLVNLGQSTIDSLLKVSGANIKEIEHLKKDYQSFKQAVSDFSVTTTQRLVALSEARRSASPAPSKKNDEKPN